MRIQYKNIALLCFLMSTILASCIRWVPIDNETFASLYPGTPYPTPLMPYPVRYPLLAGMIALVYVKPVTLKLMSPLLLSIAALAFVSVIYSVSPRETVVSAIEFVLYIGYSAIAITYLGVGKSLKVIWHLGAAILVGSFLLGINSNAYGLMSGIHEGAWKGVFNHKNVYGPFISAFLLITVFGNTELRIPRLLRFILIAIGVFSLIKAGSTTATLAFIVTLGLGGILSLPILNGRKRLAIFAVVGALSIPLCALLIGMLPTVVEAFGKDLTFSGRIYVWAGAWDAALRSPLGYGFETSGGEAALVLIKQYSGLPKIASVHSAYIKMLLDIGFLGAALFIVWIILSIFNALLRQSRASQMMFVPVLINHAIFSAMEIAGGVSPSYSLMLVLVLAAAQRAEINRQPAR